MSSLTSISFCIFLFISLSPTYADAAKFDIRNNCSFTVWAAAPPVGGHKLEPGKSWPIKITRGTTSGRIWGRTSCNFDDTGRGSCQTGDCDGLLHCQGIVASPSTVAEYALNQSNNLDYFDISLVDGFNVPMEFSPDSGNCTGGTRCTANINRECPEELRVSGGCNGPCAVFKTDEYCCISGVGNCRPTDFSRFFKQRCPDAYSYPYDDPTSAFTCPGGTNYRVVFCP